MIHNSKPIETDKSSSLTFTQRIQINIKNWHAQQLDMTNFWVAAWLDDQEVLRSFLFYLIVFMCVHQILFIVLNGKKSNKYEYKKIWIWQSCC